MPDKTITIYCALCRKETSHAAAALNEAEVTFACTECSHAVKFPVGISREELDGLIAKHKEHTEPLIAAVQVEAAQRESEKWLDAILSK